MCSMCGSAYGGYGSTYNMRNNQPKIQTKKYLQWNNIIIYMLKQIQIV